MGSATDIAWTDATWNPWIGCQRVSPGCEHCYAEADTFARVSRSRGLELWGPPSTTTRHRTSADNWRLPERLNRRAAAEGRRIRLFVASLCDVFESHPMLDHDPGQEERSWRFEALSLLERCTNLDVQLLTKRPENIVRMVPARWLERWPAHVWIGTSAEDQRRADERIPHLLRVPAAVRFLSVEPMLGPVDLRCLNDGSWYDREGAQCYDALRGTAYYRGGEHGLGGGPTVQWVIVGGESGPKARPCDVEWIRSIVLRCREAEMACFVKQLGSNVITQHPMEPGAPLRVRTAHPKGGDPAEWTDDLQVRQFPPTRGRE